MKWLRGDGYHVIVYEPTVKESYMEFPVEEDIEKFKSECDIVLANRMAKDLESIFDKVYCRDIFNKD